MAHSTSQEFFYSGMTFNTSDDLVNAILQRQKQLEDIRVPWEKMWKEISKYVHPLREDIDQDDERGQEFGKYIYDGTAVTAVQSFTDGMYGNLVSPALAWLHYKHPIAELNEMPEVKQWLQHAERRTYDALARSNFYQAIRVSLEDAASIGTTTMYSEENIERKSISFVTVHPAQIYIAEDAYGEVDLVHRKVKIEARQAYQRFGDSVSDAIKRAAEDSPFTEFEFLHVVYPRKEFDPNRKDAKNKKYASVWVEVNKGDRKQNILTRESGYDMMPYAVWRFTKTAREAYGRGPSAFALPEIKSLNLMSKGMARSAQLHAEPPWNVPSDMRGSFNLAPNAFNYYEDPQRIAMPMRAGGDYPVGIDWMQRLQDLINKHYKVEFFTMLANAERQMTATEILERAGEKAAILASAVARMNHELLDPIIDRVFDIEFKAGRILPPPPILQEIGGRIEIEYVGPLAKAQKRLFETSGVTSSFEMIAPLAQVDPGVIDIIDVDQSARIILNSNNYPARGIRPAEEVDAIRQQRAQQMAQQQQMAMMMQAPDGIQKLAKAEKDLSGGPQPQQPSE